MNKEVQQYCLRLPESKLQLVLQIREIVLSKNKLIKEKIKFGRISFTYKEVDIAFICVKSINNYIELGFFKGANLKSNQLILNGKNNIIKRYQIKEVNNITANIIDAWFDETLLSITI